MLRVVYTSTSRPRSIIWAKLGTQRVLLILPHSREATFSACTPTNACLQALMGWSTWCQPIMDEQHQIYGFLYLKWDDTKCHPIWGNVTSYEVTQKRHLIPSITILFFRLLSHLTFTRRSRNIKYLESYISNEVPQKCHLIWGDVTSYEVTQKRHLITSINIWFLHLFASYEVTQKRHLMTSINILFFTFITSFDSLPSMWQHQNFKKIKNKKI